MRKYFPPIVWTFLVLALLFFYLATGSSFALVCGWIFIGFAAVKILNRLSDFFPSKLSSLIHWIHAMVFEVFAVLLVLLLHPLGFLWKLQSKGGDGRPILLVHGYLHDSSAWVYHKRQLRKHGFGPIYMINLGYPFLSIQDYVKKVEARALHIAKETGRKDLILIGHSMGGIVSAMYALRFAPQGTVTDVVTIASPLAGTHVARIAIGSDGREMERNSQFLKGFSEEIRKSRMVRFYHIATKTDQLVIPYTSELTGGGIDRQYILNDIGHVSLLYSPRVAQKITSWILNESKRDFLR